VGVRVWVWMGGCGLEVLGVGVGAVGGEEGGLTNLVHVLSLLAVCSLYVYTFQQGGSSEACICFALFSYADTSARLACLSYSQACLLRFRWLDPGT